VDNAFEYAEGLKYELTVDGKKTKKAMAKRDQFGPELLYFSDCILQRRQPEPSSKEGCRTYASSPLCMSLQEPGEP
jgi:glucose-fructose oxidoreductase